jgi:hypothetical protein
VVLAQDALGEDFLESGDVESDAHLWK